MFFRQASCIATRASSVALGAALSGAFGHERRGLFVHCEKKTIPSKADKDWDKRHPYDNSVKCQGKSRVVLFIRHGQYETSGGPNFGLLTDVGREQAKMAGQHIVARMRQDPSFKKAMFKITSSAMERAIETADIIEREIAAEVAWVDVKADAIPRSARLKFRGMLSGSDAEFELEKLDGPLVLSDESNLLQPELELRQGVRVRVSCDECDLGELKRVTSLTELKLRVPRVSVHQPLVDVQQPSKRFEDWTCDGCGATISRGSIHWSDNAESNRLGFCDKCFKAGPKHRKLKDGDTFARTTVGEPSNPFRMPNDKNLNEACPEPLSGIDPDDPLFDDFAELSSQVLKEQAQANAGFCEHMHRAVDHKRLERQHRKDVVELTFAASADEGEGEMVSRHWTVDEFKKLEFDSTGDLHWIFDEEAKVRLDGRFRLKAIAGKEAAGLSRDEMVSKVLSQEKKQMARGRQVEIFVVHGNIIRYFFLRLMQFDTSRWLDLGGSNCTMTQLRIRPDGLVLCDFFAAHESCMPITHYTYNKHSDV